jgi:acyl-CoA thioester hydrolase
MLNSKNKFTCKYRIYWEDTDAGGVVYYANYLKFFERARTELLRELNISQSKLSAEENLAFMVKKCEIDYKSSAKLDDLISVSAEVINISNATIEMFQEITLNEKIISVLKVQVVCVDTKKFKPARIPLNIKQAFKTTI